MPLYISCGITLPPLMTSFLLQWILSCVVWIFSVYHRLTFWATVFWIVVLFWNSCEVGVWPIECVSKGKALVRPSSSSAIFFPSGLHHMKKPLLYSPATTDGDVPAVASPTMVDWNPLKLDSNRATFSYVLLVFGHGTVSNNNQII